MTEISLLTAEVHARFREAFGPPNGKIKRDDHWSLERGLALPNLTVLIDGTGRQPDVWVFDPHSSNDGVMRTTIASTEDIAQVIATIQTRMNAAGQKGANA